VIRIGSFFSRERATSLNGEMNQLKRGDSVLEVWRGLVVHAEMKSRGVVFLRIGGYLESRWGSMMVYILTRSLVISIINK